MKNYPNRNTAESVTLDFNANYLMNEKTPF